MIDVAGGAEDHVALAVQRPLPHVEGAQRPVVGEMLAQEFAQQAAGARAPRWRRAMLYAAAGEPDAQGAARRRGQQCARVRARCAQRAHSAPPAGWLNSAGSSGPIAAWHSAHSSTVGATAELREDAPCAGERRVARGGSRRGGDRVEGEGDSVEQVGVGVVAREAQRQLGDGRGAGEARRAARRVAGARARRRSRRACRGRVPA